MNINIFLASNIKCIVMIQGTQNKEPATPRQRTLQKYLKMEKTTIVQYSIIQSLMAYIQTNPESYCPEFYTLYSKVQPQMRNLTLFQYLNFQMWNDTDTPRDLRDKTQFFVIVSEWIISYEMNQQNSKTLKSQIALIHEYLLKNTKNMFERVMVFEQIHQDLIQLLGVRFWGELAQQYSSEDRLVSSESIQEQQISKTPKSGKNLHKQRHQTNGHQITKQDAQQIIKLLTDIVSYFVIDVKGSGQYVNCSLNLISTNHCAKYKLFMEYAIKNVLSVNQRSSDKGTHQCLEASQQNEITRIALIFLQRHNIQDSIVVDIIKKLMLKTSKMVRYSMIVDYVHFYEYLERTGRDAIIEELQDMVYFRELIIGRNQVQEAKLLVHTMGPNFSQVTVAAGSRSRLMYSHEQVYGSHSLLQIELQIQGGDINLIIYHFEQNKQKVYWREDRTTDRRVDIILKSPGLYIVELDNCYSWMKSKKILYKIEQYGKMV